MVKYKCVYFPLISTKCYISFHCSRLKTWLRLVVNEHRGRISQQGGNGSCFAVHGNIGVKSVDNQYVFNIDDHTDTNESNSMDQYQSK